MTINAVNVATGQDYQTQSMSAGRPQVPVAANGTYQVTATENGQVISSKQVQVGDVNAMADFVNNPANDQPTLVAQPTTLTLAPTSAQTIASTNQASQSSQSSQVHQQMIATAPPQQDQSPQADLGDSLLAVIVVELDGVTQARRLTSFRTQEQGPARGI